MALSVSAFRLNLRQCGQRFGTQSWLRSKKRASPAESVNGWRHRRGADAAIPIGIPKPVVAARIVLWYWCLGASTS
jgi:hypothetical protein